MCKMDSFSLSLSLPLHSSSALYFLAPLIPCRKFFPHTQTDRCTDSLHCKKFNHTFLILCFKFNQYKHCSKCYEKKCTLDLLCFYTRQAEAENYIYQLPPFHPLSSFIPPIPLPLECVEVSSVHPPSPPSRATCGDLYKLALK